MTLPVPKRAGATLALAALIAAGCATQSPAPVTPAPKKPAAAQPKPAAPKPAPPSARPAEPPMPKPEVVAGRAVGSRMSGADARALLDHHNKARFAVGLKPLKWSAPVATHAQKWAEKLAATSCRMQHSSDSDYGENLYQGTQGVFTALDASRAWEAEKKDLDGPLTRANLKSVGHYTQMVWRETARVGCGEATCNKTLIVVCNYDPPGNYLGRKPY
ncbi:MAG TPA: CAP domain-containing protein [Burkholderiales bacterium]|jgi:pathogenesis-related protein 1|nr:CAP domain-containing protein [Burkholderiales bacterium]